MLSSPRKPVSTMRIFSSAENCRRVARRISFTTCSAGSFTGPDFCPICAPSMATMGQKFSLPQLTRSVSVVLTPDNQYLQAAGAPRIGRQDSRREADAPGIILGSATVAHARLAHADRADAGHYLAFGQVPVTNHAAQTSSGLQIDMLGEEFRHLGLDRLGQ